MRLKSIVLLSGLSLINVVHAAPAFVNGLTIPAGTQDLSTGSTVDRRVGFFSDIYYDTNRNEWWGVSDRGPGGGTLNYETRVQRFSLDFDGNSGAITNFNIAQTLKFSQAGSALNGLAPSPTNNVGNAFDPEGLVVHPKSGNLLVSDEYGPSLFEIDRNTGAVVKTYTTPANVIPRNAGTGVANFAGDSGNTAGKRTNRGFEGLAISPDGNYAYAMLQSAMLDEGAGNGTINRIVKFDTTTGKAVAQYAYEMKRSGQGQGISAIVAINDHEFYVLERNNRGVGVGSDLATADKEVFKIDLNGATDVTNIDLDSGTAYTKVTKSVKILDLDANTLAALGNKSPEKWEGLAIGPRLADGSYLMLAGTDNDYSVTQNGSNTQFDVYYDFKEADPYNKSIQCPIGLTTTCFFTATPNLAATLTANYSLLPGVLHAYKASAADLVGYTAPMPENSTRNININSSNNNFSGVFYDVISGVPNNLKIINSGSGGSMTFTGNNTYTGYTEINSNANFGLAGLGSIDRSDKVIANGLFDITKTTNGTNIRSLTGSGFVSLGTQNLTLTHAKDTFAGIISGSGQLLVSGGRETLTGNNTYTGGTTVNNLALLQLGNGGTMGSITGNVSNNGSLIFNRFDNVDFLGSIQGNGILRQQGLGVLNLTNISSAFGGTFVDSGILAVNNYLTSNVFVSANTVLQGTGIINGTVAVNGGTLAPGNSPGTLSVTNTVTMSNNSIYREEIDGKGTGTGKGNFDRLVITGNNSQFFASGQLMVQLRNINGDANNTFTPQVGDVHRIITAQGGILGQFNSFNPEPLGMATNTLFEIFYNANNSNAIDLVVLPKSFSQNCNPCNQNALNTAQALSTMRSTKNSNKTQNDLLFSALTNPNFSATMLDLAGEIHADMAAAQPVSGQWLQGSVFNRLNTLGAKDNIWLDFNASRVKTNDDSFASAYSSGRYQFAVGYDLINQDLTRLGLGFSYANADISTINANGNIEEFMPFIYGQHGLGNWIFDSIFSYGFSNWKTYRSDPIGLAASLNSRTSGESIFMSTGARYSFSMNDNFKIEPSLRVIWQNNYRGAFLEQGNSVAMLALPKYDNDSARMVAGIHFTSAETNPLKAQFTYRTGFGIGKDFNKNFLHPELQAEIANTPLTIHSSKVGTEFVQMNLQGTYKLFDSAYAYLGINGEARTKQLQGGVNAGFNVQF